MPWPLLEPFRADLPAGTLLGGAAVGGDEGLHGGTVLAGAAAGCRVPPCTLPRTLGSVLGSGSAVLAPPGWRCCGSRGSSEREAREVRPDAGAAGVTSRLGGARGARGARCAAADAESADRGIAGLCRPLAVGRAGLGKPSSNSSTAHSDEARADVLSATACASPTPPVLSGPAASGSDGGGAGRPLICPSGARPFSSSQKGLDF